MIALALIPVFFPILVGVFTGLVGFKNRRAREIFLLVTTTLNSLLIFAVLFASPSGESFVFFHITDSLPIAIQVDGLSKMFAGLIAFLWPFAISYSLEYMKIEGSEDPFYAYYMITYGVTCGIAFSANLMSLYLFYEFLTLVTLPIVMHGMKEKNTAAGRKYVRYSIGGAAFAFIGMMVTAAFGGAADFTYGGSITSAAPLTVLRLVYVFAFFGFGVKAAVFPFHAWLPTASIAPTPVTALLHAVAVVNCGAFSIIRITYYVFGTQILRGSWAQYTVMAAAMITILYGSSMALKEQHFKRRLAYSTISNLSYMLLGAALMSPEGLTGSLAHFIFHGIIKITLFFVAGIMLNKYEIAYVNDLFGMGRKMKVTFACFTVAALGLMGVPPTIGFISKWKLLTAAAGLEEPMGYAAMAVILISAILTAMYLLSVIVKLYFPGPSFNWDSVKDAKDPNGFMTVPLIVLAFVVVALGIFSTPLIEFIGRVAGGLV